MTTTLSQMQARVHAWAVSKGWAQTKINDPDAPISEVEVKLAKLAMAHIHIDEMAEAIRVDPNTDIGEYDKLELPDADDCSAVKVLAKLELIHTEVTEAVEAVVESGKRAWINHARKNDSNVSKPEGLGSELVDINVRCNQLAADLGIDLAADSELKMAYNDGRPYKHEKHA